MLLRAARGSSFITPAQRAARPTRTRVRVLMVAAPSLAPPPPPPTAVTRVQPSALTDNELLAMIAERQLSVHRLETVLGDCSRAVSVRRQHLAQSLYADGGLRPDRESPVNQLPMQGFDTAGFYDQIEGANCEAVIGYLPVPVGCVGPLALDAQQFRVPLATTEGALVASTNRGCRAMALSGGAISRVYGNGMTRAPLLRVKSLAEAAALKAWVQTPENAAALGLAFNSTTNFGKMMSVSCRLAGRNVYVRFSCHCGDAMGMNMVTKGTVAALKLVQEAFPEVKVVSLSGNMCADKKPAAINWIEGRGRSVACEVVLKKDVVENLLHTTVDDMIQVNINKNLVGSAMSGSIGGFNAHAANIVSAIFLATGNDIAQNVESSHCITLLEKEGEDLHCSVTMPSIEVGTIGGGTSLPGQKACLGIIGCAGANREVTGGNADTLARVVAGTVLAGEISLIAALASGDLLKAHMDLGRKAQSTEAPGLADATLQSSASLVSSASLGEVSPDAAPAATAPRQRMASHIGHPSSGGPLRGLSAFNTTPSPATVAARFAGEHAARVTAHQNRAGAGPLQGTGQMYASPAMHTQPRASSNIWYGEETGPRLPCP